MAMRRPRIKVAANLAIRRPVKPVPSGTGSDTKAAVARSASEKDDRKDDPTKEVVNDSKKLDSGEEKHSSERRLNSAADQKLISEGLTPSPTVIQHAFKFPKPVDEPPRITTPAPVPQSPLEINVEEPHSPKKFDSKFAYINALNSPRKRIRTESMTSNKSYSDVSLKSRKTIKQEESQKASDAKRDLRKRLNNIQNIDKQSLTMFDMIYYNPAKNPMKSPALSKKGSLENIPHAVDRGSRGASKSRSPTPAPMMPPPPPPELPKQPPQLTPQLKLGPNGEMILDESSLVIENEREKEMRDTLAKTEIVYVDEFSGNSGYYSRYKRTRDWPPEETIRFYRCLHTIGTDFSMMIQLFPNRSRRDLKLKFKKEERLNLMLVNKALLYPKEFNIEELKQQFQEEDDEIERQREIDRQFKAEAEEKLKQQKLVKRLQLNQSKNRNPKKRVSRAARVMMDDDLLPKSDIPAKKTKPKRKKRKADNGNSDSSREQTNNRETAASKSRCNKKVIEEVEEEHFDDVPDNGSGLDDSDHEQMAEVNASNVTEVPYVPNGAFTGFTQPDEADTSDPVNFRVRQSPKVPQSQSTQSTTTASDDTPLDIESMYIDIIDDESRSLYEIKPEPKVFPVRIYESRPSDTETPNVITLQNLDDHSQTTVTYQEPTVRHEAMSSEPDTGIDSIESKYYGGCGVEYIPMPANTAIAHPVKAEVYNPQFAQMLVPSTHVSPPIHYDLHPALQPASLRNDDNRHTVSQQPVSNQNERIAIKPDMRHDGTPVEQPPAQMPNLSNESLPEVASQVQGEQSSAGQHPMPSGTEEDQPHEPGPLDDIDINSLVLVESQDTTNPSKTIYEIYVIDPKTGKLSENPLDVPEDVIENIRSILEVGED